MTNDESPTTGYARFYPLVAIIACLVPILITFWSIHHFGVNIPFADDWAIPALLEKYYAGRLTFADLFALHNEHRVIFSRAFIIFLAPYTHFNIKIMLYAMPLFLLLSLLIFFSQLAQRIPRHYAYLWVIPISFLLFSPRQIPILVDQADALANIFVPVFSLVALHLIDYTAQAASSLLRYILLAIAAVVAATIATFSLAAGVCIWLPGLLLIILTQVPLHKKIPFALLWSATAIGEIILFFQDWQSSPAGTMHSLQNPFALLMEIVKGFGFVLFEQPQTALYSGIALTVLLIAVLVLLLIQHRLVANAFWIALLCFAFAIMAMITIGRLDIYKAHVLRETRYFPIVVLTGIALYGIIVDILYMSMGTFGTRMMPYVTGFFVILIVAGTSSSYVHLFSYRYGERFLYEERASEKRASAFYMYAYEQKVATYYYLKNIPVPMSHNTSLAFLKQHSLTFFDDMQHHFTDISTQETLATLQPLSHPLNYDFSVATPFFRNREPFFTVTGYALDSMPKGQARQVYIAIDDKLYPTLYGTPSYPDGSDIMPDGYCSGFAFAIPSNQLDVSNSNNMHTVSLTIVTRDKRAYYQTPPMSFMVTAGDEQSGDDLPALSSLTQISGDYFFSSVDAVRITHTLTDNLTIRSDNDSITITGWAIDHQANDVAGGVYVEIDGILYPAVYGYRREDVAQRLQNPRYELSGFRRDVRISDIGIGDHRLAIKIITNDQTQYYAPTATMTFSIKKENP